jgi:hypothetical protein
MNTSGGIETCAGQLPWNQFHSPTHIKLQPFDGQMLLRNSTIDSGQLRVTENIHIYTLYSGKLILKCINEENK